MFIQLAGSRRSWQKPGGAIISLVMILSMLILSFILYFEFRISGRYLLSEEQEIEIGTEQDGKNVHNTLRIQNGSADMIHADCPDQLCVNQRAISKVGETIVCLPHKIVVEVEGENKSDFDAIAN